MTRRAGILCPLFSVPGNQGIGDLGQKTLRTIDAIAKAGYTIWQLLPLQAVGMGHSPYMALSSFAGDPIYINIDRLAEMGLLTQSSIVNCNKFKDLVNYEEVRRFKEHYFRRAWKAFKKNYSQYQEEFETFRKEAFWLEDWCQYKLFKGLYDQRAWPEWDEEYRNWQQHKDEIDLRDYSDELGYQAFLQFLFDRQLKEVSAYARGKGVLLMADFPFYTGYDSADVWSHREWYCLDAQGNVTAQSGLPPEAGTHEGQVWDMPCYDFIRQKQTGYAYWHKRVLWTARYFDLARLDHFRAFDAFWKIPAGRPARDGRWIFGPGLPLLEVMKQAAPNLEFVAEDLGILRPEANALRMQAGLAGMDVLMYRLDSKGLKKEAEKTAFLYTGTHDTPTLEEEYQGFDNNKRISLRRFFKKRGYTQRAFHDLVVKYALDSAADTVILPIQDVIGLKGIARMNVPGLDDDKNWTWKLKDFKTFPDSLAKTTPWLEESGRLVK